MLFLKKPQNTIEIPNFHDERYEEKWHQIDLSYGIFKWYAILY